MPPIRKKSRSGYNPSGLAKLGLTSSELEKIYPDFIGKDNFENSVVVKALRSAPETKGQETADKFESWFAELFALHVLAYPDAMKNKRPNIRLRYLPTQSQIEFTGGSVYPLSTPPTIVMEYGPGIVSWVKILEETRYTPLTLFIDKNPFVCHFLRALTHLSPPNTNSPFDPKLGFIPEGIKSTTDRLVEDAVKTDLIMASMIHSAGEEEIAAGIINGYKSLKEGGILAVQAVRQVDPGEVSGTRIRQIAEDTFQRLPKLHKTLRTIQETTGRRRDADSLVFVR